MRNLLLQAPNIVPPRQDSAAPEATPVLPPQANDNDMCVAHRHPEARTFELPPAIWRAMVACYAVFLIALLGATGGARAALAIAISGVYVAMFFGTARVMMRQAPPQPRSPLHRASGSLQTAYGLIARREVYGQVLIVPATIALFALAVSVIGAVIM